MSGEYGDSASFPCAEPNLFEVKGKLFVVYSFFELGMKSSVMVYSVNTDQDVIQFAGASMFLHHH